jgi:hypothetical protein
VVGHDDVGVELEVVFEACLFEGRSKRSREVGEFR